MYQSAGQAASLSSAALTGKQCLHRTSISDSEIIFSLRHATSQNCGSHFPLESGDLEGNVCCGNLSGKYRSILQSLFKGNEAKTEKTGFLIRDSDTYLSLLP